jgi:hypothetical protein
MGISVDNGNYYTPMVGGGEANILQTYNTEGVSAPTRIVNSPIEHSVPTVDQLAGENEYADVEGYRADVEKGVSLLSAFGPVAQPSEANGWSTDGWATSSNKESESGDSGWASKIWKEFKSLDGKTQSVLASTLFSAIGGVMKNDTAKDKLRQDQQVLDLKRQQQDNAMRSTAESYDKSKYKVRGLLNPEAKLTYSTQTGVKK